MSGPTRIKPLTWRIVLQAAGSNALLLWLIASGRQHYLVMQALLVVEWLVVLIVTAMMYRERGLARNLAEAPAMLAFLVVVLLFAVLTFGFADRAIGAHGAPCAAVLAALRVRPLLEAFGFIAIHLGLQGLIALCSRRPRLAWATAVLAEGAISQVALMVVVFMPPALFLAVGLVELAASASGLWTSPLRIDADVTVGVLWVLLRCALTARVLRIPDDEVERIARQPYLD